MSGTLWKKWGNYLPGVWHEGRWGSGSEDAERERWGLPLFISPSGVQGGVTQCVGCSPDTRTQRDTFNGRRFLSRRGGERMGGAWRLGGEGGRGEWTLKEKEERGEGIMRTLNTLRKEKTGRFRWTWFWTEWVLTWDVLVPALAAHSISGYIRLPFFLKLKASQVTIRNNYRS